jgi:hypothetical protein
MNRTTWRSVLAAVTLLVAACSHGQNSDNLGSQLLTPTETSVPLLSIASAEADTKPIFTLSLGSAVEARLTSNEAGSQIACTLSGTGLRVSMSGALSGSRYELQIDQYPFALGDYRLGIANNIPTGGVQAEVTANGSQTWSLTGTTGQGIIALHQTEQGILFGNVSGRFGGRGGAKDLTVSAAFFCNFSTL